MIEGLVEAMDAKTGSITVVRRAVIVTGDIRAEPHWIQALSNNPILSPYLRTKETDEIESEIWRRLDNIYLDTTNVLCDVDVPTKVCRDLHIPCCTLTDKGATRAERSGRSRGISNAAVSFEYSILSQLLDVRIRSELLGHLSLYSVLLDINSDGFLVFQSLLEAISRAFNQKVRLHPPFCIGLLS